LYNIEPEDQAAGLDRTTPDCKIESTETVVHGENEDILGTNSSEPVQGNYGLYEPDDEDYDLYEQLAIDCDLQKRGNVDADLDEQEQTIHDLNGQCKTDESQIEQGHMEIEPNQQNHPPKISLSLHNYATVGIEEVVVHCIVTNGWDENGNPKYIINTNYDPHTNADDDEYVYQPLKIPVQLMMAACFCELTPQLPRATDLIQSVIPPVMLDSFAHAYAFMEFDGAFDNQMCPIRFTFAWGHYGFCILIENFNHILGGYQDCTFLDRDDLRNILHEIGRVLNPLPEYSLGPSIAQSSLE
jgi:hypothetical protein